MRVAKKIAFFCEPIYRKIKYFGSSLKLKGRVRIHSSVRIKEYPEMGREHSRPKTAPAEIGPGGWIGERCSILKGTRIGRNAIVGY